MAEVATYLLDYTFLELCYYGQYVVNMSKGTKSSY